MHVIEMLFNETDHISQTFYPPMAFLGTVCWTTYGEAVHAIEPHLYPTLMFAWQVVQKRWSAPSQNMYGW